MPVASKTGILFSIYVNLIYHFMARKGCSLTSKRHRFYKNGTLYKLAKK